MMDNDLFGGKMSLSREWCRRCPYCDSSFCINLPFLFFPQLRSNVVCAWEPRLFCYSNSWLMSPFSLLLFTEIARVRASLFQINGVRKEPLQLPEPDGETVTLNEKVYVPVKEHPDVSGSHLFVIMMSCVVGRLVEESLMANSCLLFDRLSEFTARKRRSETCRSATWCSFPHECEFYGAHDHLSFSLLVFLNLVRM